MIDFTLTDEQKALRELAHDFATKEIRPVAWEYDKEGTWPQAIIEEVGLMNVHVGAEYGGPGLSYLDGCVIEEEIATQGPAAVDRYIDEVARVGFDILGVSAGFISIPTDDMLRLVERVQRAGPKAKPEVGIQFGAGGATTPAELEQEGTRDVGFATDLARRCLDVGAYMIMIESEGITEAVTSWRTDVVARIARELGLEKVMFEAADPEVFGWYVKNYGPEVNLFVDQSQIVQLERLRRGIWGTKSLSGRVVTYSPGG